MSQDISTPKDLDQVINNVILSIQNGQEEIFNISENVIKETESIKREIESFKERVNLIIKEVEELEVLERKSRNHLFIVSKNFDNSNEKIIREAYEKARDIQVKLIVKREEEKSLIKQRNDLELRLKKNIEIVERAQSLMSKMKSVMDFLLSDLADISKTISNLEGKAQIGMKIIKAQEEERRRIARDIHDGPAQSIAFLVIKTEIAERLIKKNPEVISEELEEIKSQLRAVLKEIRTVMYDLRPTSLDELGLIPTIQRIAEDLTIDKDLDISVTVLSEKKITNHLIRLTCYRIIQEGINNIIKHSKASKASIKLDITQTKINGVISDEGEGFDINEYKAKETVSFGLSSMKERAEMVNGKVKIDSIKGKGTKIIFSIPNKEEEYE